VFDPRRQRVADGGIDVFMLSTQSAINLQVTDTSGLSTAANWNYFLWRLDHTLVDQPDQLVPNGSVLPILFRGSGSSTITPTITLSKNGAAFAAPAGTPAIAAVGNGLWKFTPEASDTSTNGPLAVKAVWATPATTPADVYSETQIAHHFVFADAAATLQSAFEAAMAAAIDDANLDVGFNRSGPGATEWTATIDDIDAEPIQGARVWVTSDADGDDTIAGYLTSDDDGKCLFLLDQGGTYYLWAKHSGKMQIAGQQFTVT
jgi:hypothetical protein